MNNYNDYYNYLNNSYNDMNFMTNPNSMINDMNYQAAFPNNFIQGKPNNNVSGFQFQQFADAQPCG